ncbi:hypothetical protein THAOC_34467, partial [Thalassiosira oceanica]
GDANCSTTPSLHPTAVGNIESRLIDEFTPAAASSDLQIRTWTGGQPTDRGAAEMPLRSPAAQISGRKAVNDVINGSGTSAGRARAMMHKFAVTPASLIDKGGRRAIGIALRPQHFKGDVLGMNRCHGRRRRATRGGYGGARLSLSSLLRRCAGRADGGCLGVNRQLCGLVKQKQKTEVGSIEASRWKRKDAQIAKGNSLIKLRDTQMMTLSKSPKPRSEEDQVYSGSTAKEARSNDKRWSAELDREQKRHDKDKVQRLYTAAAPAAQLVGLQELKGGAVKKAGGVAP